ncbi:MAG: type II secretion system F family protein [Salinisphaeraceae bacterium]
MAQKLAEVQESARVLRNMIAVGMPMDECLMQLSEIQRKWADKWKEAAKGVARGRNVSGEISRLYIWPSAYCEALKAGEASGSMVEVLSNVETLTSKMSEIKKTLSTKIITPALYAGAGILIFCFYVIWVIPKTTENIQADNRTGLVALSDAVNGYLTTSWMWLLTYIAVGGFLLWYYFRDEGNRADVMAFLTRVPAINSALQALYGGIWARYMCMLDSAGSIPYDEMVRISSATVPAWMRDSYRMFEADIVAGEDMTKSLKPHALPQGDPRRKWPVLLRAGLQVSAQTGNTAEALKEVQSSLIEDGMIRMTRILTGANYVGLAIAASAIIAPMLGMTLIQVSQVQNL